MDVYLWMVSFRLFKTIIWQRKKDIWEIEKIEKYNEVNDYVEICMDLCVFLCLFV